MTIFHRFLWGLLAGLAVICVKFVGPDNAVVKALVLTANQGEIVFYALVSFVTIMLGGISGVFAKEVEPGRILVFCAAFPALVSTASAPERIPASTAIDVRAERPATGGSTLGFGIISSAYAANDPPGLICDEGSFVRQFNAAAKSYFNKPLQNPTFAVVVGSERSFDLAKLRADDFARRSTKYRITVGCRKPDVAYFPIMVGEPVDIQTAADIKGEVIGQGWAPSDTYLSNYAYRTVIYKAAAR